MQEYSEFIASHPILTMAWFGLAGALIYSYIQSGLSKVKTINSNEATQLMNRESAIVVDIRSADEFRKGHITDAKNLPLEKIQDKKFSGIENKKQSPIIVVCESGMRSSAAAKKLTAAEFERVYNLRGGMSQWQADKLPITKK